MTFGAQDNETTNSSRIPSIVILGADALLAAAPATPIQLAHACALVGYQHVIPATWGDELIAAASLRALRDRAPVPAIQCSCPFVAHRLLAVGTDLRPFLVSLVAPPVVLARYLRTAFGPRKLRITYVGRCPGAADEVIDARLTPEELLAIFDDRQIVLSDQPQAFDSVIPPDRRRYRSQPGGLPTPDMLWSVDGNGGVARSLIELHGDDLAVELAQHLLSGKPILIDVAPKLGCVCSGAAADIDARSARERVTALEPPRSSRPVLDESLATDATLSLPASPRSAMDIVSPPAGGDTNRHERIAPNDVARDRSINIGPGRDAAAEEPTAPSHTPVVGRRHSPPRGIARAVGRPPTARDADGRQLPRTYVARRRPSTHGTRHTPPESHPAVAEKPNSVPSETATAPTPDDPSQLALATSVVSLADSQQQADAPRAPLGELSTLSAMQGEHFEPVSPIRAPTPRPSDDDPERGQRITERPVVLPVTRLSDGRPRPEPAPTAAGDRPVMQILTLGLLIAMIVLVSAAVGVLVGRWMSQR